MEQYRVPKTDPHIFSQLTFDKVARIIQLGEKRLFSTSCAGKTGYPHGKQEP